MGLDIQRRTDHIVIQHVYNYFQNVLKYGFVDSQSLFTFAYPFEKRGSL